MDMFNMCIIDIRTRYGIRYISCNRIQRLLLFHTSPVIHLPSPKNDPNLKAKKICFKVLSILLPRYKIIETNQKGLFSDTPNE